MINIGTSTINAVKLGTTNISAVYIGTTKLYPALDWFYLEDASGSANTVSIVKNDANAPTLTIETSTNGYTWTTAGTTSTTALDISVPANEKVYVRCSCTGMGNSNYYNRFTTATGDFKVGGNAMSLLYGSNFTGRETSFPTGTTNAFYGMFSGNTHLVDASDLELPATTLGNYCYNVMFRGTSITAAPALPAMTLALYCYCQMFQDCTSLTTAPALPATTLAQSCYASMFRGCTALTTAPVLNATTLAENCYQNMLRDCTALTSAPALPAMTLATGCYQQMFMDCSNLTSIPAALPATTLAGYCYQGMFQNCSSLTSAPTLPAMTLAGNCYNGMFAGCTSLTTAPALNATTLAGNCYQSMFKGCTALTTPPTLPATTFANNCYQGMFRGCSRLTSAPVINGVTPVSNCLVEMFRDCPLINSVRTKATTWNDTYASNWLSGVAATGTFYNDGNATIPTSSASGVPTGWSVVNNIDYFYFENATNSANTVSIKKGYSSAPTLTIETSTNKATWTTLGTTSTTALNISIPANGKVYVRCSANSWGDSNSYNVVSSTGDFKVGGNIMSLLYGSNFTGSETSFPASTTCFYRMFYNATHLVDASNLVLPATTLAKYCYRQMFNGCTALTAAPALPATTLVEGCYKEMFESCTSLTSAPELPATTLVKSCYELMFWGCSHLTSIKVAFTSWPNTSSSASTYQATYRWTHGLPASGTFYKKSGLSTQKNASGNTTTGDTIANCTNAIPYNWAVTNY